jgi:hypothetical protein
LSCTWEIRKKYNFDIKNALRISKLTKKNQVIINLMCESPLRIIEIN